MYPGKTNKGRKNKAHLVNICMGSAIHMKLFFAVTILVLAHCSFLRVGINGCAEMFTLMLSLLYYTVCSIIP